MKWLKVTEAATWMGCSPSHITLPPNTSPIPHLPAGNHQYSWVERGTVTVEFLLISQQTSILQEILLYWTFQHQSKSSSQQPPPLPLLYRRVNLESNSTYLHCICVSYPLTYMSWDGNDKDGNICKLLVSSRDVSSIRFVPYRNYFDFLPPPSNIILILPSMEIPEIILSPKNGKRLC